MQEACMDCTQYLQDRASEFAARAVWTDDPMAAQILKELAMMCRESAERLQSHGRKQPAAYFGD
jgi:hypothetical protein